MTRQQFIAALADWIRRDNSLSREDPFNLEHASFTQTQIDSLASFCQSQNPQFNRQRWLNYVASTHVMGHRSVSHDPSPRATPRRCD